MTGRGGAEPGDDELLAELAEALREVTPLAERIAQNARVAFSWRTVDHELFLASLSFDSSVQPEARSEALGRRGPDDARIVVFTASPLSVELEVLSDRVVGQILPPSPGEITLEGSDGSQVQVQADPFGFFALPAPTGDRVRLRCETPTGRVVTDWVRL